MQDKMRTSVATIAINAEIIPETACYQRGREKKKDLGDLRKEHILGGTVEE